MHTIVVNGATLIACVLLPFAVFLWPRLPKQPKSVLLRWGMVCIIGWFVLLIAGQTYGAIYQREYRKTGEVPAWDPDFTIGVTLVFGWAYPLVASVPFMLLRAVIELVQRRRSRSGDEERAE